MDNGNLGRASDYQVLERCVPAVIEFKCCTRAGGPPSPILALGASTARPASLRPATRAAVPAMVRSWRGVAKRRRQQPCNATKSCARAWTVSHHGAQCMRRVGHAWAACGRAVPLGDSASDAGVTPVLNREPGASIDKAWLSPKCTAHDRPMKAWRAGIATRLYRCGPLC